MDNPNKHLGIELIEDPDSPVREKIEFKGHLLSSLIFCRSFHYYNQTVRDWEVSDVIQCHKCGWVGPFNDINKIKCFNEQKN